ncbi:glycohydrolase toxin TNT-related protein [Streptococcus intermedius]
MSFHVEVAELYRSLQTLVNESETAIRRLEETKTSYHRILTSNSMHGQVGTAISEETNTAHTVVVVRLKHLLYLLHQDFSKELTSFQEATGESSPTAVLDEEVLLHANQTYQSVSSKVEAIHRSVQQAAAKVSDLIVEESDRHHYHAFQDNLYNAREVITKAIEQVSAWDAVGQTLGSEGALQELQLLLTSLRRMDLPYSDPNLQEVMHQLTPFAEAVRQQEEQLTEALTRAKRQSEIAQKKAKEKAKKEQADWRKHHPLQSFLSEVKEGSSRFLDGSTSWMKQVDLPLLGEVFKALKGIGDASLGFVGDIGFGLVQGGTDVAQYAHEGAIWGVNSLTGQATPKWMEQDLKGGLKTSGQMVQTIGKYATGLAITSLPGLEVGLKIAADGSKGRSISGVLLKELAGVQEETLQSTEALIKKSGKSFLEGDTYTRSRLLTRGALEVGSFFVGAGELRTAVSGSQIGSRISKVKGLSQLTDWSALTKRAGQLTGNAFDQLRHLKEGRSFLYEALGQIKRENRLAAAIGTVRQDFSRHPARVHLGKVAEKAEDVVKSSKTFKAEKVTLKNGDIAYKSADLINGKPVLVRSRSFLDDAGRIKWPAANGFVVDSAGNPITQPANLKAGQVIDRFGNSFGRFTSPVDNGEILPFNTRGLPYPEGYQAYHQYEIVKDINLENIKNGYKLLSEKDKIVLSKLMKDRKFTLEDMANLQKGQIAKIFGQGGGTQIQFGTGVVWYEKMGLLKEVVK